MNAESTESDEPQNKTTHWSYTTDDVTPPAQYSHLLLPHLALDVVDLCLCLDYLEPQTPALSVYHTRHYPHTDVSGHTLRACLQILASQRGRETNSLTGEHGAE